MKIIHSQSIAAASRVTACQAQSHAVKIDSEDESSDEEDDDLFANLPDCDEMISVDSIGPTTGYLVPKKVSFDDNVDYLEFGREEENVSMHL